MDAFSYLSVLLSIILGLAITQILQGFRDLMQARTRLRLYWPCLLWAIILLVICVQEWWAMFSWRHYQHWTFQGFSLLLAQAVATYLVAALALPDVHGDEPMELYAYYYANHRWFFSLLAIAVAISIGKDVVLSGHLPDPPLNAMAQVIFIVLSVIGALTVREAYHKVFAPLGGILFGAYIAVLFTHLR